MIFAVEMGIGGYRDIALEVTKHGQYFFIADTWNYK